MQLSEMPEAIKRQADLVQQITEMRDSYLNQKKRQDIEIERIIQAANHKNELQRDIARFDLRDDTYKDLLSIIQKVEHNLAVAKIELQYFKDTFEVLKLEQ